MKIRNRNGRNHAVPSVFDTLVGAFGSATSHSLRSAIFTEINPLDKYCPASPDGILGRLVRPFNERRGHKIGLRPAAWLARALWPPACFRTPQKICRSARPE